MTPIRTTPSPTEIDRAVDVAMKSQGRTYIVSGVFAAVLGTVCIVVANTFGTGTGVTVAILYGVLIASLGRRAFTKAFSKPGVRRRFSDAVTYEFTSEGLNIEFMSGIRSFLPWTSVTKIEKYPLGTAVFLSDMHFHFVNDFAFATVEDRERAWALAITASQPRPPVVAPPPVGGNERVVGDDGLEPPTSSV